MRKHQSSFRPSPWVGNQEEPRENGVWPFQEHIRSTSNAPPIYDTRANAYIHWTTGYINPTARVNIHVHLRSPLSKPYIYIYIYPNTSKHHVLSILHIHIVCLRECECVLLRGRSWQSYGTVARLSLIDAFSSNPPNPYVRVELTKRKSFGQRSLDNRASEL